MKKHMLISLAILVALIAVPVLVFAQISAQDGRPIGGLVLDTTGVSGGGITCPGFVGPLTVQSFVPAIPGPSYFIRTATKGTPRIGGFILGKYMLTPDLGACVYPDGAPAPVYELFLYGVSR